MRKRGRHPDEDIVECSCPKCLLLPSGQRLCQRRTAKKHGGIFVEPEAADDAEAAPEEADDEKFLGPQDEVS
jgi:hypothetical protein